MKLQLKILFGQSIQNWHDRNITYIIYFPTYRPDIFNYSHNDINITRMLKLSNFQIINNYETKSWL